MEPLAGDYATPPFATFILSIGISQSNEATVANGNWSIAALYTHFWYTHLTNYQTGAKPRPAKEIYSSDVETV